MLENGECQREGETQSRKFLACVVASTNRDLKQKICAGHFRAALYHRLSVLTIGVLPIRKVGEDRLLLLPHFCEFYARESGAKPFTPDTAARATRHTAKNRRSAAASLMTGSHACPQYTMANRMIGYPNLWFLWVFLSLRRHHQYLASQASAA